MQNIPAMEQKVGGPGGWSYVQIPTKEVEALALVVRPQFSETVLCNNCNTTTPLQHENTYKNFSFTMFGSI